MPTASLLPKTQLQELQCTFEVKPEWEGLFSASVQDLLVRMHRRFEPRRQALIAAREKRSVDSPPGFLPETRAIREGAWQCASLPSLLQGPRMELTGPATRKFLINGLNAHAHAFVAQVPDQSSSDDPACLEIQRTLREAANRTITLYDLANERFYKLEPDPALLMLAPRPWHESVNALKISGQPVSAGWLDTALYFFHNAHLLLARGQGPYFYLSNIETQAEAQLWNDVFLFLESDLGLPLGQIRISLLVESLPTLFALHEILYALRDYAAAVGCGCRSSLPAGLEHLIHHPELEIPASLKFGISPSLKEVFSKYLVRTCRQRGILAIGCMGSMSPYEEAVPAQEASLAKFRADKVREAKAGFDGTRVSHPQLVDIAKKEYGRYFVISIIN